MTIWYNNILNKFVSTIDLGNCYLLSKDSYRFNGKSYLLPEILAMGYEKIGDL